MSQYTMSQPITNNTRVDVDSSPFGSASAGAAGVLAGLLSATTLSRLLKASLSTNISLKFLAFDLSALILSRVVTQLHHATHVQSFMRKHINQLNADNARRRHHVPLGSLALTDNLIGTPLRSPDWPESTRLLAAGSESDSPSTHLASDMLDAFAEHEASQIQLAAEYYVSIAKERKLLQIFAGRVRTEAMNRKLFSRYSR